jgi:hypothetical protein
MLMMALLPMGNFEVKQSSHKEKNRAGNANAPD